MKNVAFRPTTRLIKLLSLACILVVLCKLFEPQDIDHVLIGFTFVLIFMSFIDLLKARNIKGIQLSRDMPNNFSFNRWHTVNLEISNETGNKLTLQATEHLENNLELQGLRKNITIEAAEQAKVQYQIKALQRGLAKIGSTELCIFSQWQLWQVYWLFDNDTEVKVYPDFNRINQQQSLKGINNLPINGLKQIKKRGQGIEFHQLREFRQGDSIRQIDWQATSKRQKLISKEYQEEQNQHVIVMLDAGSRMNIQTQMGSHFDAALNALLMLSHTVLKQGDWFSMQSFNQQERWLAAVKGAQNVSRVMNHFYDLYPDESATDYMKAVTHLLAKRSKRALVLVVTTINDQDIDDLLPSLKKLQQHHLVALVNIENQAIKQTIKSDINSVTDADSYCAAIALKNVYDMNLKRLAKEGILCIDTQPEHLLPHVINTYLNVKHSGML